MATYILNWWHGRINDENRRAKSSHQKLLKERVRIIRRYTTEKGLATHQLGKRGQWEWQLRDCTMTGS